MKRHSFDANEVDESRLNELKDKLKLTFAAIMRDAIKLLHKKEIQNVSKVLFIVALCIASASCGGQSPKMPINPIRIPTPTPTPIVNGGPGQAPIARSGVVFFGDSVTARWDLPTYFPGKNYINGGIGGYTTGQLLAIFPDILSGTHVCTSITGVAPFSCQSITPPSMVMIFAGWNDILGGLDMNQAAANIRAMLALCQQSGVTCIVSTVYRFDNAFGDGSGGALDFDENVIDQSIRTAGATYIDLEALFMGQENYTVDGVHPNSNGYTQMTAAYNAVLPSSGVSGLPGQVPIIQTSDQVFLNVAETWTFQNGFGDLSWVDVNPVDATHSIWHYHKNATEAYWGGGTPQAELWFYLEKDAAGNWYSTGGIINAPVGNGQGSAPALDVAYPVNTKPPNARPYLIIPAATGFTYTTLFDDTYPIGGTTLKTDINALWSTSSYTEEVTTPVYTGLAFISDQSEETCIREKWYFAPGKGMVKVSPLECPGVDPRLDNIRIY
jgi:lysophospholipase L1-like esterase